jgi:hypothetical protein
MQQQHSCTRCIQPWHHSLLRQARPGKGQQGWLQLLPADSAPACLPCSCTGLWQGVAGSQRCRLGEVSGGSHVVLREFTAMAACDGR